MVVKIGSVWFNINNKNCQDLVFQSSQNVWESHHDASQSKCLLQVPGVLVCSYHGYQRVTSKVTPRLPRLDLVQGFRTMLCCYRSTEKVGDFQKSTLTLDSQQIFSLRKKAIGSQLGIFTHTHTHKILDISLNDCSLIKE